MSEKKETKEIKLTYRKEGDYYLPNVTVHRSGINYGRYGAMRREWLKANRYAIYMTYLMEMRLDEHLAEVNQQMREAVEAMIVQLREKMDNVPDKLTQFMEWNALTDSLRKQAEEILLPEIVYC